jgi:hypothetical protein
MDRPNHPGTGKTPNRVLPFFSIVPSVLSLALSACASSAGDPAAGFMSASIEAAFIPLSGRENVLFSAHGAAVVIAPGIAVTNAHNENLVEGDAVLGRSQQHDLLFFRIDHGAPLATGRPQAGETVVAYGEGQNEKLRISRGVIQNVRAPVKPLCQGCLVQYAFTFDGNAGPGFSGGPVLSADGSRIVGITFGYVDKSGGTRLMYAYDMALVEEEWRVVRGNRPRQ